MFTAKSAKTLATDCTDSHGLFFKSVKIRVIRGKKFIRADQKFLQNG